MYPNYYQDTNSANVPTAAAPGPAYSLQSLASMLSQFMPSKTPSGQWPADNTSIREEGQTGPNMLAMQDILASFLARPRTSDTINAPYGSNMRYSAQ